jgi:prepilin-type N-terminal cleavage/methylation domain-containing protein
MKRTQSQSGFSLLELLVVIAILTAIMGIVFESLATMQKRYRTEEQRLDLTQESRDYLDEIVRDLHNAGYPNTRMFPGCAVAYATSYSTCTATGTAGHPEYSKKIAWGVVAISATDIIFEGDVNQDGTVDSIRYQVVADTSSGSAKCPCLIRRSQVTKVAGAPTPAGTAISITDVPLWGASAITWNGVQGNSYSLELQNLINSAGGASAYPITGNTPSGASNDTVYGTYKTAPVFTYFDANGTQITVPNDLSTNANLQAGVTAALIGTGTTSSPQGVKTISVVLNLLIPNPDMQSQSRPGVSMRASVRLNNF